MFYVCMEISGDFPQTYFQTVHPPNLTFDFLRKYPVFCSLSTQPSLPSYFYHFIFNNGGMFTPASARGSNLARPYHDSFPFHVGHRTLILRQPKISIRNKKKTPSPYLFLKRQKIRGEESLSAQQAPDCAKNSFFYPFFPRCTTPTDLF